MRRALNRADAEDVAIKALGFVASDPERLDRFLSLTGLGPDNLRSAAGEPWFLASVLDYIASDEELVLSFAGFASMKPETVAAARRLLGGEEGHWD